ncbi:MAG: FG-GAP repeat domain-containing protein [Planctomycetota bacterium]
MQTSFGRALSLIARGFALTAPLAEPVVAQLSLLERHGVHPYSPFAPHEISYVEATGAAAELGFDGGRTELEFGDLNGDGHADLVTVGDHGSPFIGTQMHGVTVWFGDGRGGWTLSQTGTFGYGGIALGDVNNDGLMDVGYGVHHDYSAEDLGDQLLEVALGDGTGVNWTAWDDGLATSGETWGMFGTDFGDVDSDGDLDVGSNSFGCCAGVHVYRNHGDGTWSQSFGFVSGNSDMDFLFADVNGDGHLDAVSGNQDGTVWIGDGTGGFSAADGNLPAGAYRGVAAGDIDGDGRDELGVVTGGLPQVWSWNPGNVWTANEAGLTNDNYEAMQLVDMDGDGHRDVLAFGNGLLSVFLGNGEGAFRKELSFETPGINSKDCEALRAGTDFDHNGYPDVALVQDEGGLFGGSNKLRIFREASAPTHLFARVTAPSRNRVWRGGQVRFVDWNAGVPGGAASAVTLELSTTGPDGPWSLLAADIPDNGRHQLVVPSAVNSAACRIRLTVTAGGKSASALSRAFRIQP